MLRDAQELQNHRALGDESQAADSPQPNLESLPALLGQLGVVVPPQPRQQGLGRQRGQVPQAVPQLLPEANEFREPPEDLPGGGAAVPGDFDNVEDSAGGGVMSGVADSEFCTWENDPATALVNLNDTSKRIMT